MSKDEKYMSIAKDEAKNSNCSRRSVGAVIEKNGKVISTGYNGIPKNLMSCTKDNPCYKQKNNIPSGSIVDASKCMSIHAEVFAIITAAKNGYIDGLSGATLYITHQPCRNCALCIIAADISRVVYEEKYPDNVGIEFLEQAKISIEKYPENQKTKGRNKLKNHNAYSINKNSLLTSNEGEVHA